MKQKFRMFTFVHCCREIPLYLKSFKGGFSAIVGGTYSQQYGGDNIKSYSLHILEDGKVVNSMSWFDENELMQLPEQDRAKAEEMVEEYNLEEEGDE